MRGLIDVYWLVNFIPGELIDAVAYFLGGWFVYAVRKYVDKVPLEFNVSLTSVFGGFALAFCVSLASMITRDPSNTLLFMNSWYFWAINPWPCLLIIGLICLRKGHIMWKNAMKSLDPQFAVDEINNRIAVPAEIFTFFTMILPCLVCLWGNWTWRQPVMIGCLAILFAAFIIDTKQGRLQQPTYIFAHRRWIIYWIRDLFPREPLGWEEEE